jgi:hypothetical protein
VKKRGNVKNRRGERPKIIFERVRGDSGTDLIIKDTLLPCELLGIGQMVGLELVVEEQL